ncbi:hypothetical protein MAPG_00145 [Magnaporthiopsis poae ATCC 64411]|uniref:Uncharacterized protein n=1 Tax=Magnaporthiopsis poae (strain ATCC 64411 / 73-15) TaxID=644358 RepID=A0A0C4DK82_MAGP6|nr:hypothetical protein MAPG_00145 [Magnaporthiopsis poae ATCC 64411]
MYSGRHPPRFAPNLLAVPKPRTYNLSALSGTTIIREWNPDRPVRVSGVGVFNLGTMQTPTNQMFQALTAT